MSNLQVEVLGGGNVRVAGEITFFTVNEALSFNVLSKTDQVKINLGGITRSDSAGLALMIHWMREAKKAGVDLSFEEIPENLFALAKVSYLDELLPIG